MSLSNPSVCSGFIKTEAFEWKVICTHASLLSQNRTKVSLLCSVYLLIPWIMLIFKIFFQFLRERNQVFYPLEFGGRTAALSQQLMQRGHPKLH